MDDTQFQTVQNIVEGEKPLGDWTAKPAVPASNALVTNTSGHAMLVEITGGTVTAVKVDGVTVGARQSGSFRVRNGSTIAITYSVAPTWQWFHA